VKDFKEMFLRVGRGWGWTAAQFWATLLIVLVGVVWTRVPENHWWQVGLTLLLPLLMLAATLVLEAGTMRSFFNQDERRVRFAVGALTLLVWIAVVWLAWFILDWCDDQIPQWAGYLNSRASANARARVFTYEHISTWFSGLEWILRWIVVPAKVIPHAMASAEWGGRLPWRRVLRMMLNWQWWIGAVIAALVGVLLPSYFFNGEPHGTETHQVWAVSLKVAGASLLAMASWVLLLAWAAVLLARSSRERATTGNSKSDAVSEGREALSTAGQPPHGRRPVRRDPGQETGGTVRGPVKLPLSESGNDAGGNI
jgi:hypothetical protein